MDLTRNHFQLTTSCNAPYTFSGKEKDVETGYGYFGARYYDSGFSIWLSVDPMAEKYPYQTNYVYCSNNPVKIIDPNGKDEYFNEFGVYLGKDASSTNNIRIMKQQTYNSLPNNNPENNLLFLPDELLKLKSTIISEADLSISSYTAIFQHYNTTNLIIKAGNSDKFKEEYKKMAYCSSANDQNNDYVLSNEELQIPFYRVKGDSYYDDYYRVINTFDHKKGHQQDRINSGNRAYKSKTKNEKEKYAVEYQMNAPSFQNLTPRDQAKITQQLESLNK